MSSNFDFVDETNPAIFTYAYENGLLPDYVLDSEQMTSEKAASLANVAFADQEHRLYPCHTKAATCLSALWDAANANGNKRVTMQIAKMAAVHDITEDVEKIYNHFEDVLKKEASAVEIVEDEPEKFALSVDYQGVNGRGLEHVYSLASPFDCAQSARQMMTDYEVGSLPLPIMHKAATALIREMEDSSYDMSGIPAFVIELGTPRVPNMDLAYSLMESHCKSAHVNEAPYIAILDSLSDDMEKSADADEAYEKAVNAADKMYYLDLDNGVDYRGINSNPYDVIFAGPELRKLANYAAGTIYVMNVPVPVDEFLSYPENRITAAFPKTASTMIIDARNMLQGPRTIEKCSAAGDMIATLPENTIKALLKELANYTWN